MTRNMLISVILLGCMGLSHAADNSNDDRVYKAGQTFGEGKPVSSKQAPVQTDKPSDIPEQAHQEAPAECEYRGIEEAKLANAVRYSDFKSAKEALDCGASANSEINYIGGKTTILAFASAKGNADIVKELIKRGAWFGINEKKDIYGYTALMHAAVNGHPEIIRILVSKGADPDIKNNNGEAALLIAATYRNFEAIKELVACNANPNTRDHDNMTPLMHATARAPVVEFLINTGNANVFAIDDYANTALDIAIKRGHTKSATILADAMAKQKGGK
ncbi:ankyrin repeat domain-containing protein [Elusimicrobiota bacterium]